MATFEQGRGWDAEAQEDRFPLDLEQGYIDLEIGCGDEPGSTTYDLQVAWRAGRCAENSNRVKLPITCVEEDQPPTTQTEPPWTTDPALQDGAELLRDLGVDDADAQAAHRPTQYLSDVWHSNGLLWIPQPIDETGFHSFFALPLHVDDTQANALFNDPGAPFACDSSEVVCAAQAGDVWWGSYYLFVAILEGDLPTQPADHYQFSVAADRDDDLTDNLVPSPYYPLDFWADGDTFLAFEGDPTNGWSAHTYTYTPPLGVFPGAIEERADTQLRVIFRGNALVWMVTQGDLPFADPWYRFTSFRHDGTWGMPGPWSADLEPPVGEPMYIFPWAGPYTM